MNEAPSQSPLIQKLFDVLGREKALLEGLHAEMLEQRVAVAENDVPRLNASNLRSAEFYARLADVAQARKALVAEMTGRPGVSLFRFEAEARVDLSDAFLALREAVRKSAEMIAHEAAINQRAFRRAEKMLRSRFALMVRGTTEPLLYGPTVDRGPIHGGGFFLNETI